MKKNIKKILLTALATLLFLGNFSPQMVVAKQKKHYTELMLDYKRVKIRVPDKDFLTDGINYSLHYKTEKDRWAVQTSLFTRREDAENADFQPSESFLKSKTLKLKNKYQIDYKIKGLSYEITVSFTKKHKKFFEKLTEKDFIIEKDKGEEIYKNEVLIPLFTSGVDGAVIKDKILSKEPLEKKEGEALDKAKKLIKPYRLKENYVKAKLATKRQKAGILLAETMSGEDLSITIVKQRYLYKAAGYQEKLYLMDEEAALLEFGKGKEEIKLFFVYDGKKINVDSGKLMPGTDKTIIYSLKTK